MPGTVSSVLLEISHLIPTVPLWDWYDYCPYFTDQKVDVYLNELPTL